MVIYIFITFVMNSSDEINKCSDKIWLYKVGFVLSKWHKLWCDYLLVHPKFCIFCVVYFLHKDLNYPSFLFNITVFCYRPLNTILLCLNNYSNHLNESSFCVLLKIRRRWTKIAFAWSDLTVLVVSVVRPQLLRVLPEINIIFCLAIFGYRQLAEMVLFYCTFPPSIQSEVTK